MFRGGATYADAITFGAEKVDKNWWMNSARVRGKKVLTFNAESDFNRLLATVYRSEQISHASCNYSDCIYSNLTAIIFASANLAIKLPLIFYLNIQFFSCLIYLLLKVFLKAIPIKWPTRYLMH